MHEPREDDRQVTARRITARETLPLRMSQLRQGYPEDASIYEGDDDPETVHVGAFLGGTLVSVASMYLEPRPEDTATTVWRLRGMATDPQMRRRGAGAAALKLCLAEVVEQGATLAWCNARMPAVPFYEADGWRVVSDEFEIPTVGPHVVMERPLP